MIVLSKRPQVEVLEVADRSAVAWDGPFGRASSSVYVDDSIDPSESAVALDGLFGTLIIQ